MNEYQIVALVSVVGWLILVGSSLSIRQVSRGQAVRYALIWGAIILGLFMLFGWLQSS